MGQAYGFYDYAWYSVQNSAGIDAQYCCPTLYHQSDGCL